jgi:urease accessory protein
MRPGQFERAGWERPPHRCDLARRASAQPERAFTNMLRVRRRFAAPGSPPVPRLCCGAATAAAAAAPARAATPPSSAMSPPDLTKRQQNVGGAVLGVDAVLGKSAITQAAWSSPMRLLMPKNAAAIGARPPALDVPDGTTMQPAEGANWVYSVTYGGGLLSGDAVAVDVSVGEGCTTVLATQSSTKVYGPKKITECPAADGVTRQTLRATVGDGALLALLPDPVVCYEHALFDQEQLVELQEGGSVVSVDCLTAGRVLRGERWDFSSFVSGTTVTLPPGDSRPGAGRRTVVADRVRLANSAGCALDDVLMGLDVTATMILFGPRTIQVQLDLAALSEALTAGAAERRLANKASGENVSHRIRRSLTAAAATSGSDDDAPAASASPRALLAALGGNVPVESLPTDWTPPPIPKLASVDGVLMSVSPLDRPAASVSAGVSGWEGCSVGGMVVRIAASEVEDMFRVMARGLRSLETETGLCPYADRFAGDGDESE